jgi:carboxymethylenebutenolidase
VDQLQKMKGVYSDRVGVVGFSMGASWSLLLSIARPESVAAVVVYYGSYGMDYSKSRAAYLGHFAETDEWEPAEEVRRTEDELKKAGREVTFHVYPGTGHWFVEGNRPDVYQPQAAELAWERTIEFLNRQLKK